VHIFFVLVIGSLVLGAYLEFGAWDLDFSSLLPFSFCLLPCFFTVNRPPYTDCLNFLSLVSVISI
jgi:hypothetical protein